MAVLTLSVLFGALWGVVRAQTITFQSLDAASSSASLPSGNSSFVFDGSNSDIAQQLYVRYKAGDTRDEFTDAFMAANTTKPTGSAWVTTWLQQEFAQDSGFDMLLLIPIVLGAVAVVGLVGVFWRWRVKKKEQEKTLSNAWEHSGDYSYFMSGSEPGEMVLRPMIVTSQLTIDPANRPTARELVQWLENSDGEQ
ncbi:hypothetical protein KRP22_012210 [Phytophthora ramorum]|nr:hypothetical protein KRP22_14914 [Phytophthora ramorum]